MSVKLLRNRDDTVDENVITDFKYGPISNSCTWKPCPWNKVRYILVLKIEIRTVLLVYTLEMFFGAIAEYSSHSLVLQMIALTQTTTLTLMSVNKT